MNAAEPAADEPTSRSAIRAAAVIVPAHNEQERLAACLQTLAGARRQAESRGLRVLILVVADACTDRTAEIARTAGVMVAESNARTVGAARALGATRALAQLETEGFGPHETYLAHTDADTLVPPDWLLRHLAHAAAGYEGVLGSIRVTDWAQRPPGSSHLFHRAARAMTKDDCVYGANFGVRADTYLRAGGFPPLAVGEDRALADTLVRNGVRLARDNSLVVMTSARMSARAPGGFSDYLTALLREPGLSPAT